MIDAVEHRELVAKLAYGFFMLPEDPRLRVHIADGSGFVRQQELIPSRRYDLILVDAYDDAGMDDNMGQTQFLNACHSLLTEEGLLAINLWGRDRSNYRLARRALQKCFSAKPLFLPSEGTTNVIAIALRRVGHKHLLKSAETRAKPLQTQTGVEFVRLARILRNHNGSLVDRFLSQVY